VQNGDTGERSVELAKYEVNMCGSTKRSVVYNSYKRLEEEAGKGHGARHWM